MATANTGAASATSTAVKLDDVGATIVRHVKAGETSFSVRLDPAELGKVDVKVDFSADGSARAHLVVERRDTFDALSRDQRHIEQTLRDAGFEVKDGSVSMSMRQDGGQQDRSASFARQDQQQQQQQQQQSRQAQANNTVRVKTEDDTQTVRSPSTYRPRGNGRIDISV
jgi:flagellar hook-length control protein FliK